MSAEEIKKNGKKVYEADGFELPWPSLDRQWSKETHLQYFQVTARNNKENKHIVIGKLPDEAFYEIDAYKSWSTKRELHAIIKNGNYKMVDKDGKVKLHKQTPKIKFTFKIYDK